MRIAFDTGGTFTDCVFLRGGRLEILKVPSTPRKPSDAIANALDQILAAGADASRPRTGLRHHGWHERPASTKRRARHPCDDRRVRRRPRNWKAGSSATLQPAVREAGAAGSEGAAPWTARKARLGRPRAVGAVRSGDRTHSESSCPQRCGFRRHLLPFFLRKSFPRKTPGPSPLQYGTPCFCCRTKSFPNIANSNGPPRPSSTRISFL